MNELIQNLSAAPTKPKTQRTKRRITRKQARVFKYIAALTVFTTVFAIGFAAFGADNSIQLTLNGAQTPSGTASTLQMLFLLTLISLAPSILIMMTSFTRIIIVLSMLRNALGLQQSPPNQVLVGIALFLSLFIMTPVLTQINNTAYSPYVAGKITMQQAQTNALKPIRNFMLKNTENTSMKTFLSMAKISKVKTTDEIPTQVIIPAFILSELKKAFMMGFVIYLPFLVIDIIVSSTLMSMGMMMLPPQTISLPLKIALFVLVDGWTLTVTSLVHSFK